MAALGYLESLLNTLPAELRKTFTGFVREAFKTLAFGVPDSSAVASTNFRGHLVPVTTASVADAEVAVPHGLGRRPVLIKPCLDPNTVGAYLPEHQITRASDAMNVYISSAVMNASFHLYIE